MQLFNNDLKKGDSMTYHKKTAREAVEEGLALASAEQATLMKDGCVKTEDRYRYQFLEQSIRTFKETLNWMDNSTLYNRKRCVCTR
jgi:hypothetical protein